ncbi:MAG: sugar ABC transporter permease [Planctomycetes bacterium]|nr:sugar ABC transporter permease [Planctomycetota bacterium]
MTTVVKPMPVPRRRSAFAYRARLLAILYLLCVPTMVGVLLFTYYPNIEVVKYAFYRWDGSNIVEYRGLENFRQAFGADPLFWGSFELVGILLIANLVKMWPSILVAIALHRLNSQRWQYLYRVLFVLPMVIPGLVWLLIWKTFFTSGMFNDVLHASGAMWVFRHLDAGLPALATTFATSAYQYDGSLLSAALQVFRAIPFLFASSWGLALFGIACLVAGPGIASIRGRWLPWLMVLIAGAMIWEPTTWQAWNAADGVAVAWHQYIPWRLLLLPILAAAIPEWLRRRDRIEATTRVRWIAWGCVALASLLILLTETWVEPTGQFSPLLDGRPANPAWLGHSKLVIPALMLWGFPWVGTIGVLIYLAGLQNISTEVYEAAELDGVGPIGKIFRIELPLILTQVRINLIFMTIGTLTDYAFYLLLLGPDGGSDNKGMVPGLYMYNKAFIQNEFGYACTLGMCMFVIVLALTVFYQKYVKVEK